MTDNFSRLDVCDEIFEDLSAFIDGELEKEQLAKIYEHLLECEACKQNYESLKLSQKAVKNYFKNSTEKFVIPEKNFKVMFAQKQKMLIYIAALCIFVASITYFSINLFNVNKINQETIHKVKFIEYKKNK